MIGGRRAPFFLGRCKSDKALLGDNVKVLVQRVSKASVCIDGEVLDQIERGLVMLVGFGKQDSAAEASALADKIANLRIFSDANGRFQYSVRDLDAEVLVVPQFTLYADTRRGRRPEFTAAMPPERAAPLFKDFVIALKDAGIDRVAAGRFGANMQVELTNDGPVTLMLER